jgi:uncharacterized membrane protein YkvA (DUF1232 family)
MRMFGRLGKLFLLWRSLSKDGRTPLATKVFPWAALLYLLVPIDVVPDFVPLLGQLDDVGIILLLISIAMKAVPKGLWQEHDKKVERADVIDV